MGNVPDMVCISALGWRARTGKDNHAFIYQAKKRGVGI
jgi:hypothetical protein